MIQLFGALIKFKICPKSKQTKLTKVSSVSKKIKEDVQYFLAVQYTLFSILEVVPRHKLYQINWHKVNSADWSGVIKFQSKSSYKMHIVDPLSSLVERLISIQEVLDFCIYEMP